MALHLIPDDGTEHTLRTDCPCHPTLVHVHTGAGTGLREAIAHRDRTPTADPVDT
jgi:hypothetical protein